MPHTVSTLMLKPMVQYKVHCNTILLSSCFLATERVVIDLMERMLNGVDLDLII